MSLPNRTCLTGHRVARGRLRDVLALGAREVRMVIPSLRLLLAPWSDVFDELDVLSLISWSQQAPPYGGRGDGRRE